MNRPKNIFKLKKMTKGFVKSYRIEGKKPGREDSKMVAKFAPAKASKSRRGRWVLPLLGTLDALIVTYLWFLRPWQNRWGATDEEVQRPMPGDDLIKQPWIKTTRAITINAPASKVWPWLAQLGQGRGGWYSYEWIENLLGLDIHNTNRILPEFQNLKVGDTIPTGAKGVDIPVLAVESEKLLLLGGSDVATIAFGLYPIDAQHTRLVARHRAAFAPKPLSLLWFVLLDPGVFIMFRKMLLTIKQRAERLEQAETVISSNGHATVPTEAEIVFSLPHS